MGLLEVIEADLSKNLAEATSEEVAAVNEHEEVSKENDIEKTTKDQDVEYGKETIHSNTIYGVVDKICRVPERPTSVPMRMPISGNYKIKDVGDVMAGRVEQDIIKPGEEVALLPTHTASNPCTSKVLSTKMHQSDDILQIPVMMRD